MHLGAKDESKEEGRRLDTYHFVKPEVLSDLGEVGGHQILVCVQQRRHHAEQRHRVVPAVQMQAICQQRSALGARVSALVAWDHPSLDWLA